MPSALGQLLIEKARLAQSRTKPTPAYERFPHLAFRNRDWKGFTRHGRGDAYPLYTQDTMRNLADHLFDFSTGYGSGPTRAPMVRPCDLVYSTLRPVRDFLESVHSHIRVPYLLLTDTSDVSVTHHNADALLNSSTLYHWWASDNEVVDSPKLSSVPLGISDNLEPQGLKGDRRSVLFHGNVTRYLAKLLEAESQPRTLWVMSQMSMTHGERRVVRDLFGRSWGRSEIRVTTEGRMTSDRYLRSLGRHRFILSPRGNGLDSHRTWEALLVGTVPIVRRSALDSLYDSLPVLVVDDWTEVTVDRLERFYREYKIRQSWYHYEKLFADYWIGSIAVHRERCLAEERAKHAPNYKYGYHRRGGWVQV